jgi:hypothetical protein
VPVVGQFRERVGHAGLHARRGVGRQPQVAGDLVGGLEAHAPDVAGHPVGILLHHLQRVVAVGLVDFDGQPGGDAVALQEQHHLADVLLLLPGFGDGGRPLGPHAQRLPQPAGVFVEHAQRVGTEALDDASGGDRADPLDQPGAQVALDTLDGGREDLCAPLGLELAAILLVGRPGPLQPQTLAGVDLGQVADDGHQVGVAGGVKADDRVAGFLVIVGDALDSAVELIEHGGDDNRKGGRRQEERRDIKSGVPENQPGRGQLILRHYQIRHPTLYMKTQVMGFHLCYSSVAAP